jgi:chromosome segregation ATPase
MGASTTAKQTRIEQCRKNAQVKSEQKRQAVRDSLSALIREQQSITKAAVARRAGVSLVFLRSHADLVQAIEEATKARSASLSSVASDSPAKDQVIAALRRRLDELKQQLSAKDAELRQKQREIDHLYGKLAGGSPLLDTEVYQYLQDVHRRLKTQEESH